MTPFHDLQDYQALPRLGGLRLAPDGSWLAVTVSALAPDGRTFKPSIWRVDTAAGRPAVRLTRSAEGEDSPAFLPDGSLVFLSARAAPPGTRPAAPPARPAPRARHPAGMTRRPARRTGRPGTCPASGPCGCSRPPAVRPAG